MGRSQADVAATALVAALACGAAAAGAPAAALIVPGVALFASPGYLLGQLLLDSRTPGLERVVVSAGLALAVPILGGLVLYAAGVPLRRPAWIGLLAGVTLACDVAFFLLRRVQASGRTTAPVINRSAWHAPRWHVPRWHAAAFAAAGVIAACAVALAGIGVARQPQPPFTQLWLSPQHQNAQALSLGVSNDQGSTTSYRLVLLRDGRVITVRNITLADGQTWRQPVTFTGKGTLTADLYRLPDLAHLYRHVSTGPAKAAGP
jgi:hypothetical protein